MTAPSARPSEEVPRRHPAHAVHGLQAPGTWGFAEATECWGLVGFPQKHAPPLRKRTLIYYALQSALRFIGWSLSLSLSLWVQDIGTLLGVSSKEPIHQGQGLCGR